eukprot:CAMPEP_0177608838 /NCGR_PEP_ID=MMETSP0419_2-20121207/18707_1 /TAXON_ID=582737 /ORGANISM="Tetraselmis sp., Strain GSL018" /LENGTH=242 /DNA_ID=CAMNT_0019103599 /DNA_START=516 /DNA_END=1244 /DNA_ORIENTATION=+
MEVTRQLTERGHRGIKVSASKNSESLQVEVKESPKDSSRYITGKDLKDSDLELPSFADSHSYSVADEAWSRGRWLLSLLVLQSTSSMVLDSYQQLLKDHLVVTLFLTMLVGAGGNAGNQSAIKVIRGLATGSIKANAASFRRVLAQQGGVGAVLGASLAAGGWLRVYISNGDAWNATAISLSLLLIVFTSVVMGTGLPFGLARLGLDPANAGTTIQVLMDILGVAITCATCHFVLDHLAAGL